MSYTVGIKRKFWFGHRKLEVNGHDWQNGRFILNLIDGSQEHVPGYAVPLLKVYPNFWNHLQMERSRNAPLKQETRRFVEEEPVRQGATQAPAPVHVEPEPIKEPVLPDPFEQEVMMKARKHVERILSEQHR